MSCQDLGTCASANYGIVADDDGIMFGYGWGDYMGWVSANPSDLTGCPVAPCEAKMDGNQLTGWLKVLASGDSQAGGWDGWLRLRGTSPTYGVSLAASGALSGYGWGDTFMGWTDFQYAQTSCEPCQEAWHCSGDTIVHTSPQCTTNNVATCSRPSFCSEGSSICLLPPITFNGDNGHLRVSPRLVKKGGTTKVFWDIGNVTSCSVVGTNGNNWTGATSGSSGQTSSPINQQTIFTLSCTGLDGSNIRETATAGVVPVFREI